MSGYISDERRAVERGNRFELQSQHGTTRSYHRTYEAAKRQHQRNLAWHCGICGNNKGGWGACSHGSHNRVCSAKHYNDRIVEIG